MKLTKYAIFILSVFMLSTASAQLIGKKKGGDQTPIDTDGKMAFDKGVQDARETARLKLKPYKYDATKSTVFSYKSYKYAKEVEVITIEKTDYRLCFNGSMVKDDKIGIEIYSKSRDAKGTILLYSKENVGGDEFDVSLDDLNEVFRTKMKETTSVDPNLIDKMRLKKIFISYIIPAKDRETETYDDGYGKEMKTTVIQYSAMVLAVGYLNL